MANGMGSIGNMRDAADELDKVVENAMFSFVLMEAPPESRLQQLYKARFLAQRTWEGGGIVCRWTCQFR